jgi:hypothetical protein
MAEESRDDFLLPGQHFDPGPFTLDLYRLLCLVLADQRVAALATASQSIERLQDEYLRTEVRRILISSAAALRIWFDQHDRQAFQHLQTNCGKLFPEWPQHKSNHEVLTLREACNKIIHATEINYDSVIPDRSNNPDQEGVYLLPYLYLYGSKNEQGWRAKLSIVDFVKWSAAVFRIEATSGRSRPQSRPGK